MNGPIRVQCRPLTPIWTGDVDKRCDHIPETGLRGSLRWWYEAILRGCGFHACDPSTGSCVYDRDKGSASICLACQLFGCTGYSGRFRLEVEGGGGAGEPQQLRLSNPGNQGHCGWRIPPTCASPFRLNIVPMHRSGLGADGIALTLRLIERFGALGAKTSHGQGVVRFDGVPAAIANDWLARLKERAAKPGSGAPSISDMFGTTVRLRGLRERWWDSLPLRWDDLRPFSLSSTSSWIPTSPVIRAMLRSELRQPNLTIDRHRLMGTIQGWGDPNGRRTKGSDVHVTHAYRSQESWAMRIFAFAPGTTGGGNAALRRALAASEALKEKIRTALNLGTAADVSIESYPVGVPALLADLERA